MDILQDVIEVLKRQFEAQGEYIPDGRKILLAPKNEFSARPSDWTEQISKFPGTIQKLLLNGPADVVEGHHRVVALKVIFGKNVEISVDVLEKCTTEEKRAISLYENSRTSLSAKITLYDLLEYLCKIPNLDLKEKLSCFLMFCPAATLQSVEMVLFLFLFFISFLFRYSLFSFLFSLSFV